MKMVSDSQENNDPILITTFFFEKNLNNNLVVEKLEIFMSLTLIVAILKKGKKNMLVRNTHSN